MSEASCRFYLLGACLEGELRNPGLDRSLACLRLDTLMADFDDFLDRAEAFGLSEDVAARIWDARHHKALGPESPCPHPCPELLGRTDSGGLDCGYLFRLACLLRMPACPGRCKAYSAAGAELWQSTTK